MEVPSKVIGDKVLEKLWDLDLVAYIRFASGVPAVRGYRHIMEELKKLQKRACQAAAETESVTSRIQCKLTIFS